MQKTNSDVSIESAMQLAVESHEAGRFEDAQTVYRFVLQSHPEHPVANHNLGVLAMQLDQPQLGLSFLINALESEAGNEQHWLSLLECLIRLEVWPDAFDLLGKAEVQGISRQALVPYRSRIEAGHCAAADAELLKALQSLAKGSVRLHSGNKQRSRTNLLQEIQAFFRSGDWKNMEILVLASLREKKGDGKLWHLLGVACLKQEKLHAASFAMDKACVMLPADAEVWRHAGFVLNRLGDYGRAEECYRRSLVLVSGHPETLENAGSNAIDAGRFDDALPYLERALALQPNFAQAHNAMGILQHHLGNLDPAQVHFIRALALKPDFIEALNNVGGVQRELEQFDAALNSYRRAVEIKPDYAKAFGNMGVVLHEQGHLQDAIACYENALALVPDLVEVHVHLGNILFEMSQLDAAVDHFNRALALRPNSAQSWCGLGQVLLKRGEVDEAAKSIQKGVDLDPILADCVIARLSLLYVQGDWAEIDRFVDEIISRAESSGRLQPKLVNECLVPALSSVMRSSLLPARVDQIRRLPGATARRNGVLATYTMLSAWMDGAEEVLKHFAEELAAFYALPEIRADKNLCRFAGYLQLLMHFKAQHPELYAGVPDADLNVIGDSHCLSPANTRFEWQGRRVCGKSHLVIGIKMHHLAIDGENPYKHYVAGILRSIDGGSPLLLTIGEIDCRPDEGIWSVSRKKGESLEGIVAGTVDGYLGWLDKHIAVGQKSIVVQGVPAPGYALAGEKDPGDIPGFLAMIHMVNVRLAAGAAVRGWGFLDVYSASVNEAGLNNGSWSLDGFHLVPGFYAQVVSYLH